MDRNKRPAFGGSRNAGKSNSSDEYLSQPVVDDKPTRPPALLVNARDAAALLAISTRKLWELTNCQAIPCVRIGRSVRYTVDDLRAFIESQRQTTGARKGAGHA